MPSPSDTFLWIGSSAGGLWSSATNWSDLTTSTNPSTVAPGAGSKASINGPRIGTLLVTGPGTTALLALTGMVSFTGTVSATTVVATNSLSIANTMILAGGLLSTSTMTAAGQLVVDGAGASLLDSGGLTLTSSGSLEVENGGFVRGASFSGGNIAIDPAGTVEIGSAGGAPAGRLSVDAGATLTAGAAYATVAVDAPVLLNGVITGSTNEFLTFDGTVGGSGQVLIGTSSTDTFLGSVAAGVTVAFTGASVLQLNAPAGFAATVTGFAPGDTIAVAQSGVTALSYAGTAAGGTLSLLGGAATLDTLSFGGSFVGSQFLLLSSQGTTTLGYAVNAPGVAAAAPAGPGNADAYSFAASATGGAWNLAANWTDTTTATTAAPPPGAINAVTIAGTGAGLDVVTGNGNAATLTLTGKTALTGSFAVTGAASVSSTASTIELLPGATLAAASAQLLGTFDVDAGRLTVTGTLADAALDTEVYAGGLIQAAGLQLGSSSGRNTLGIDATSAVELGTTGGAATGALNVDAGKTATLTSLLLNGALLVNGLATVTAGTYGASTISGLVSGSGTLALAAGASATLSAGSAAGVTVLLGAGSTLALTLPSSFGATLAGFAIGDRITTTGVDITATSYNAATGTLTLAGPGATPLASIPLTGSVAGASFLALPVPTATVLSSVVLAAGTLQTGTVPAASAGTSTPDSYTWTANGGVWNTAANWSDTTAGLTPAAMAPGSLDLVTIPDPGTVGNWQVISGSGNAASLTVSGNVALSGVFSAGSLTVTGRYFSQLGFVDGSIDVLAGATLVAATASLASGGGLAANGAGALVSLGTLTLGTNNDFGIVNATSGGLIRIATLALASTDADPELVTDAAGTVEIGTAGGAVAGAVNIDPGVSLTDFTLNVATNLVNGGTLSVLAGGQLRVFGTLSGNGVLQFGAGADANIGAIAAGATISLAGTDQILISGTGLPAYSATPNITILGFGTADLLTLPEAVTGASWNAGTLTLSNDGVPVQTLLVPGNFTSQSFVVSASLQVPNAANNYVGTNSALTLTNGSVACFATGTRLAGTDGEIAVEQLRIGDQLRSAFGGIVPVVWIGRRRIDCRRHARPWDVMPVRVAVNAVAAGVPARELVLSPDHALHLDGVLIPVRHLINGTTIVQDAVDTVTYWHVELPCHDIVLAEGLAAESYLDTGNRAAFEGQAATMLHPEFVATARAVWAAGGCAPLVTAGRMLGRARRMLAARAAALGHTSTDDPALRLELGGAVLAGVRSGDVQHFRLPRGGGAARVLSRSWVPAYAQPEPLDHRLLGVAIARIEVDGRVWALDDARLGAGWWQPETGLRWTDGAGDLDLTGARAVSLTLAAPGIYALPVQPSLADRRVA